MNAVLINTFEVPAGREEEFMAAWSEADALLRANHGYTSTALHRALAPDARHTFVNVAELDSVEAWQATISTPAFGAIARRMAEFSPSPALYRVAVMHEAER